MKFKHFLKNSDGVGLVEVMMAVAVTGGLTLTIAKLMDNAGQGAKQFEAKTENTNLKGIVQDVLNNPTACKNTFNLVMTAGNIATLTAGAPTASVTVPSIRDKTTSPGAIKYSTASLDISPLTITSMEVTNYNAGAMTGDLVINSTFNKSHSIVQMVKPIRIPLNFSFVAGAFSSCSTMAIGGEWMLNGNAGTNPASEYIGTSDNLPLHFRVNNQRAARIESTGPTFFGYRAGDVSTGTYNTGLGFQALNKTTSGYYNTAVGGDALYSNTTGAQNTAMGVETLRWNTTGDRNTGVGKQSLYNNTTGNDNVSIGYWTLLNNTTGYANIALGSSALQSNSTGVENVAISKDALKANTTGYDNVAIGLSALMANTDGYLNIALGNSSMLRNTSGNFNLALGTSSLINNTTGTRNVSLGTDSLYDNTIGSNNVAVGGSSLADTSTGSNNTGLGLQAGSLNTSGSNNLFLGANAGVGHTTASNKLYIDTLGFATPLIGGDFTSAGRYVVINGKLGVGVNPPLHKLQIGTNVGTTSTNSPDVLSLGGTYSTTPGANAKLRLLDAGSAYYGLGVSPGSLDVMSLANVTFYLNQSGTPNHVIFAQNGNVGMGTLSPAHKLHVMGDIYATGIIKTSGGSDTCPSGWGCDGYFWDIRTHGIAYTNIMNMSDKRLKKNIKDLDDSSVKKLLRLNPVQYEWRKDQKTGKESKGIHYGFIAQEVESVWPQLVNTANDEMKTKALAGTELISPLVKAFQFMNDELVKNKAMFKVMQEGIEQKLDIHDKAISNLNIELQKLKVENEKLKMDMRKQQDSFDERLKKLEAKASK